MIFGWDRVSPRLHYFSTLLVVIGTTLSTYWIMTANTWMQNPVGFINDNGIYKVDQWSKILFNPSGFPRFIHMLLASYISASFVICSVSAFYLLKNKFTRFAKKCFGVIWIVLLILVPTQIFIGDLTGIVVHHTQPIKTAAMEGLWETQEGAPLVLFAIPDQKNQTNHYELSIPYLAALINTHELNGKMIGLKSVSVEDQPRVATVFFSFRIMVGIGFLMMLLTLIAVYLRWRDKLYSTKWFLKASVCSAPLGFIALWCGWLTAEIGRQPWIVYNQIRTLDAISNVQLSNVIISFLLIFVVYGIIFGYFYFYFLHKTISKGPVELSDTEEPHQPFQYMPPANHLESN
jgi:cytochrome d ubiquinol oxidase subunit I